MRGAHPLLCPHECCPFGRPGAAEGPRCQGGHWCLPAFPSLPWRESLTRATGLGRAVVLGGQSSPFGLVQPRQPPFPAAHQEGGSASGEAPSGEGRLLELPRLPPRISGVSATAGRLLGKRLLGKADGSGCPCPAEGGLLTGEAGRREAKAGPPGRASPLAWSRGCLTKSIRAAQGCALRRQPS